MGVRKASYAGKIRKPLFEGYDVDFWQEQVGIMKCKGRAQSKKMKRETLNREINIGKKLRSKSPGISSDESDAGKEKPQPLDKDAQL